MQDVRHLGEAMARVARELERLRAVQAGDGPSLAGLDSAWADLVRAIDLEPAPLTRICPACGATVRRAAKLCGFCWHDLVPIS
jgi:hypothetical protein